ncbi:hypothetical protein CC85DRAFT_285065 [Cutaneotrichosporon oleaginosum]|uniref:Uncharacterized protein n=1 Tax=Cutaneotrichosporon oleaginosum TaxID=879819 RepID=A0A0J0XP85_9TREE|nr:uncharacterized protein CC85DRAFT_285065 [Cutaneotrichosporon oleaginosum]KLT42913.1 hypothetical protein CC85DRAFT_285065 [Cutaneotrichosporon oleaginosum]
MYIWNGDIPQLGMDRRDEGHMLVFCQHLPNRRYGNPSTPPPAPYVPPFLPLLVFKVAKVDSAFFGCSQYAHATSLCSDCLSALPGFNLSHAVLAASLLAEPQSAQEGHALRWPQLWLEAYLQFSDLSLELRYSRIDPAHRGGAGEGAHCRRI